jgi:ring-1,2-phenylacetyl-CoA epoxidase subunit PaaC
MKNSNPLFEYILRIADNTLIYGQRLSEWCGHGPILEEDIALSNTSLDYLGQATNLLKYAAEVQGAGRNEDDLAFLRDAEEFRNLLITELPNGDYATTMARQFLILLMIF